MTIIASEAKYILSQKKMETNRCTTDKKNAERNNIHSDDGWRCEIYTMDGLYVVGEVSRHGEEKWSKQEDCLCCPTAPQIP